METPEIILSKDSMNLLQKEINNMKILALKKIARIYDLDEETLQKKYLPEEKIRAVGPGINIKKVEKNKAEIEKRKPKRAALEASIDRRAKGYKKTTVKESAAAVSRK